MTEKKLTIREMCDKYQVTARTLRFYEAKELLSPERVGQRRLYSKREFGRLKLILLGKKFGFSLEELRQLLDMYYLGDQQATQLKETLKAAEHHLAEMKKRREELDETIADLEHRIAWGKQMVAGQHPRQLRN